MTPWLKKIIMTWHFSSCHINLGPHNIPFKKRLIVNYLVKCDYPKWLKVMSLKMSRSSSHFLIKPYKLHICQFLLNFIKNLGNLGSCKNHDSFFCKCIYQETINIHSPYISSSLHFTYKSNASWMWITL